MREIKIGKITRDLNLDECYWLKLPILRGNVVFVYFGETFDVISKNGIAVSFGNQTLPFFEVPKDSVRFY